MDVTQLKLALRSGDLIILEHWIRLAERQLRNGRIFGSGLEALCIAVAKARGTLVLEVHSVARAAIHARATWAAHYKHFEDLFATLKWKHSSCAYEI